MTASASSWSQRLKKAPFRKVLSLEWVSMGHRYARLHLDCGHKHDKKVYGDSNSYVAPKRVRCIECTFPPPLVVPEGQKVYAISEAHYQPRFVDQAGTTKLYSKAADHLFELFKLFPEVTLSYDDRERLDPASLPYPYIPIGHMQSYVLMSPRMAKLFGIIWKEIQASLETAYSRGHDDGKNLLGMLAAGKITVDELNQKAERE